MAEQHDYLQSRVSRRGVLKGAALLSAGPLLLRSARADAAVPLGPRWICFGADPRSAMHVSTSLPGPFTAVAVEYGLGGSFGQTTPLDVRGVAGTATRYGTAQLTGLVPGTTYAYRTRVDGQTSPTSTFTTAPASSQGFRFTAFGDQGVTAAAQTMVGQVALRKPRLHLVAGDLCYADRGGIGAPTDAFSVGAWDKWLAIIQPVAASVPWMTVAGNHEMEPGYGPQGYDGYLTRFTPPPTGAPGCPATYHFRYGSVAFIQVDSNDVSWEIAHNLNYSAGGQTTWLESVLANYRLPGSGIDFIVVTMHHCAYSNSQAHGSEGGVRALWSPLFDTYGVDVVISGHNHQYERSHLIRRGAVTVTAPSGTTADATKGTTYLTVGGGGAGITTDGFFPNQYRISTPETVLTHKRLLLNGRYSARTRAGYCFLVADATPSTATTKATLHLNVRDQSAIFDTVVLTRPAKPVVTSQR